MNWYYADGTTQVGPFADADFDKLIANGTVKPDTLVWREGMANWRPCSEVKPAAARPPQLQTPPPQAGVPYLAAAPTAGGVVCCECGRTFPLDEMIRHGNAFVCATCKPLFIQKLKEGVRLPGTMEYGGFWIRFGAKMIDGLILGVVAVIGIFAFMPAIFKGSNLGDPVSAAMIGFQLLFQAAFYVIYGAYSIFFNGKYGATPGKMAVQLRIVTPEGGKIGYGRATGRFFAELLSGMICDIGYIIAAFDDEKRSLHDRICNTRVIKV